MPLPAGFYHVAKGAGRDRERRQAVPRGSQSTMGKPLSSAKSPVAEQRWTKRSPHGECERGQMERRRQLAWYVAESRELSADKHAQTEPAASVHKALRSRNRAPSCFTESSDDEVETQGPATDGSTPPNVSLDDHVARQTPYDTRRRTAIHDAKVWAIERQNRFLKLAAERERERLMAQKSFHAGGSAGDAGCVVDDMRRRRPQPRYDCSSSSDEDSQLLTHLDLVERDLATASLLTSMAVAAGAENKPDAHEGRLKGRSTGIAIESTPHGDQHNHQCGKLIAPRIKTASPLRAQSKSNRLVDSCSASPAGHGKPSAVAPSSAIDYSASDDSSPSGSRARQGPTRKGRSQIPGWGARMRQREAVVCTAEQGVTGEAAGAAAAGSASPFRAQLLAQMMDWQEKSVQGFLARKSVRDGVETGRAGAKAVGKHVTGRQGMGAKVREMHSKALGDVIRAGKTRWKAEDGPAGDSSSESDFEIWGAQALQGKRVGVGLGGESADRRGGDCKQENKVENKLERRDPLKRADRWRTRSKVRPTVSVVADASFVGRAAHHEGSSTSSAPPTPTQPYTARPRGWVVGRSRGGGARNSGDTRGRSGKDAGGRIAVGGNISHGGADGDADFSAEQMKSTQDRVAVAVSLHLTREMRRIEHTLESLVAKTLANTREGCAETGDESWRHPREATPGEIDSAPAHACALQPLVHGIGRAATGEGADSPKAAPGFMRREGSGDETQSSASTIYRDKGLKCWPADAEGQGGGGAHSGEVTLGSSFPWDVIDCDECGGARGGCGVGLRWVIRNHKMIVSGVDPWFSPVDCADEEPDGATTDSTTTPQHHVVRRGDILRCVNGVSVLAMFQRPSGRHEAEDLLCGGPRTKVTLTFLRPSSPTAPTDAPLLEYSIDVFRTSTPAAGKDGLEPGAGREGSERIRASAVGRASMGRDSAAHVVQYRALMEAQTASTLYPPHSSSQSSTAFSAGGGSCSSLAPPDGSVEQSGASSAGAPSEAALVTNPSQVGDKGNMSDVADWRADTMSEADTTDVLWMLEQVVYRLRRAARGHADDALACGCTGDAGVADAPSVKRKGRRKVKSVREQAREDVAPFRAANIKAEHRTSSSRQAPAPIKDRGNAQRGRGATKPQGGPIFKVQTKIGNNVAVGVNGRCGPGPAQLELNQGGKHGRAVGRKACGARGAFRAGVAKGRIEDDHVGEGRRSGGTQTKLKKGWMQNSGRRTSRFAWR